MSDVISFSPRSVTAAGRLDALAVQYLTHLQSRGRAVNTITAYRVDLEQFVGFLVGLGITLAPHVDGTHVDDFVTALIQGNGVSHRTAARKLETVRGFFKYLEGRNVIPAAANPCRAVMAPKWAANKRIAPDEAALLAFIDSIPADTPLGKRDRALFRLMLDAALRVSGIASLDLHDPANPPACAVRPGGVVEYTKKGGGIGESGCDATTLAIIGDWLAVRDRFVKADSPPALFLSEQGTRITRAVIHARIKHWGALAGMPHLHAHLLRHRRLGEMAKHDPRLAQAWAGHARISTTLDIYGAESNERQRVRVARECPLGGLKGVA